MTNFTRPKSSDRRNAFELSAELFDLEIKPVSQKSGTGRRKTPRGPDFGYRDISQLLDPWQTRLDKEKISG